MNRFRLWSAGLVAAALAGCAESQPVADAPKPKTETASAAEPAGAAANPALLKPLVLAAKPAKPLTVWEAHDKKDGETIVVTGKVPPGNIKPFNAAVAAFVLMAPEDLDREDIKEEFECEDAATCPSCRKMLDKHGVRVELVDATGAPLPTTVEGFEGLKPGSTITVEGEVKRDGKDKKAVRIVAKKFYPG
jgi:hypothetical protein